MVVLWFHRTETLFIGNVRNCMKRIMGIMPITYSQMFRKKINKIGREEGKEGGREGGEEMTENDTKHHRTIGESE